MKQAAASLILLLASSCASPRPAPERIETCLTDPLNNLLHCDGKPKAWKDSKDYVCHPLEAWEAFFDRCRP